MHTIVTFTGNLTNDPELQYTPSGKPVTTFGVAVNRRTQDSNTGEWVDAPTTFHNIKIWGAQAENAAETLGKGNEAIVIGQLETETWTTNGETRSRNVVVVSERFGAVGVGLRYSTADVFKARRNTTPAQDEPAGEPPF